MESAAEREDLLCDPACKPFFSKSIFNLCFFFEEPKESFDAANGSCQLDNLGPFSTERWSGHIKCVHCIFPNTESRGQGYIVRSANSTHYQGLFLEFIETMKSDPGFTPVRIYYPGRDYSNEFLVVLNKATSISPLLSKVHWPSISACIETLSQNNTTTSMVNRQSRQFVDFGYTSSICTLRRHSATGVSKPLVKPGTKDPCVITCFCALSALAQTTEIPWLLQKGLEPFIDPDFPERQDMFPGVIDHANLVDSLRLNECDIDHRCGAHSDKLNSPKISMSCVVGLSEVFGNKRIAMNGYSRRAADSFLKESARIHPLVDHLLDIYSTLPFSQQVVSRSLLDGEEVAVIPGYPVIRNHCNMDPVAFHQPFLFHMLVLVNTFKLPFAEVIGLQTAYEVFPNTGYYFGLAACSMLRCKSQGALPSSSRGFGFGLLIIHLMYEFSLIASSRSPPRLPGRRFSCYNAPVLQRREVWNRRCHHKLVTCIHAHAIYSVVKNRKERAKVYKCLLSRLAEQAPKVGDLIMNHSMALMAQIGLLPAWMRDEASVSPTSRYMEFFVKKFDVDKSYLLSRCEKFISTIQAAFAHRFGRKFSIREIENVLCKTYCIDQERDRLWCDLLFPLQNIFKFEGERILIFSSGGEGSQETQGSLINHLPYGNRLVGIKELVGSLNLETAMPSESTTASFRLPQKLLYPNAPNIELEFELNDVELTRNDQAAQVLAESIFAKVLKTMRK